MGKGKDLIIAEKQKITKLLNEWMFTLKISKEIYRDHWTIKKTVENIVKLRTWRKGKERL